MYYDLARRLLRWRIYLLLGLALLAVIVGQTGFRMLGTSACEALPSFQPTVSDDLRADLELLHARGLLYCKPLREGLDDVDPIVYWAADGMNSLLFFQATAGADLSDVGVTIRRNWRKTGRICSAAASRKTSSPASITVSPSGNTG